MEQEQAQDSKISSALRRSPAGSASKPGIATLWALAIAALLLITAILPAEYGVDPTSIGGLLGLTPMGERKMVAARAASSLNAVTTAAPNAPAAAAVNSAAVIQYATTSQGLLRQDEIEVKLAPGGEVEYKTVMAENERLVFSWDTGGTAVKFDFHGEPAAGPNGAFLTFHKGTARSSGGTLRAPFTGTHGWYWKNPTSRPVIIKLRVSGFYSDIKRL